MAGYLRHTQGTSGGTLEGTLGGILVRWGYIRIDVRLPVRGLVRGGGPAPLRALAKAEATTIMSLLAN